MNNRKLSIELVRLLKQLLKNGEAYRKPKNWESLTSEANKYHINLQSCEAFGETRMYYIERYDSWGRETENIERAEALIREAIDE